MAQVHMLLHITGGRGDGRPWPAAGETLECGEQEARDLVAGGMAAWVAVEPAVPPPPAAELTAETTGAAPAGDASPKPENGSEGDGKPRVRDPRDAWQMHAISLGASPEIVAAMTKADLIAQFGNPA